ncbi:MAG: condensation domain-containing protein, partial [Solirubrobacteraceae bacterium]
TTLRLPTSGARSATMSFDGATHRFALDAALTDAVRELARELNVTPYMLLLAAFSTVLYRLGGQDDILIGGPMANRDAGGFDDVIGFFANTIVVRVRLAGNPSFAELLERVRESVLRSYEHQDVPFELVVEALRPDRDPGINPLVQVNFRVRVGGPATLELTGTQTSPVAVDLGFARFDLALELHLLEDRVAGELTYNAALFTESAIARLAEDFEALVGLAAAHPDTRLLRFPLASAAIALAAPSGIRGFRGGG